MDSPITPIVHRVSWISGLAYNTNSPQGKGDLKGLSYNNVGVGTLYMRGGCIH